MNLSKITFYDEKKNRENVLKFLLCGETKTGKTYFAGTAPNPFIIDTDGSLNGLPKNKRHIPVLTMRVDKAEGKNWTLSLNGNESEFKPFYIIDNFLRELTKNSCKIKDYQVKTIVFDGLTSLADLLMYECMIDKTIGRSSNISDGFRDPIKQKATFDEYLALEARLNILFTKVDDLGLNIIATAGLKMDKDEVSGSIRCFPDILGGFRHDVGHRFDGAVLLTSEKNKHYLHTGEHDRFKGGIRCWAGLDKVESPTWDKIIKNIEE